MKNKSRDLVETCSMCGSNKDVVGCGAGLLCEACAEANRVGSSLATTSAEAPVNISVMRVHPLAKFVDIDGTVKPPSWVIPGFIGHGAVDVAGPPGVGKTTAILPLAMTAAGLHGDILRPFHWRHVIYITEDIEQVQRILAGIVGHGNLDIDPELVRERLHFVEAVRLDPSYVATVGNTYRQQFTRTVNGVAVLPLVVIDTKSSVMALKDENDNSEASAMMAALKQGFDGLPVWLIGHVAKANLNRSDVSDLTSRGASSIGGDANQTMFLIKDGDTRYLVLGKTRFEPRWRELLITSFTAQVLANDEFGNPEEVIMRWGVASPAVQSRKEASEQAAEHARKEDAATLRQDICDAIQAAWQTGNPLNRSGVKAKIKRQALLVSHTIESLLSERWLCEIQIPPKIRTNSNRSSFLVNFTVDERELFMREGVLPEHKLVIPPSQKKPPVPSVPALAEEVDPSEELTCVD